MHLAAQHTCLLAHHSGIKALYAPPAVLVKPGSVIENPAAHRHCMHKVCASCTSSEMPHVLCKRGPTQHEQRATTWRHAGVRCSSACGPTGLVQSASATTRSFNPSNCLLKTASRSCEHSLCRTACRCHSRPSWKARSCSNKCGVGLAMAG